jgi:Protein of unknown function (DUF4230)
MRRTFTASRSLPDATQSQFQPQPRRQSVPIWTIVGFLAAGALIWWLASNIFSFSFENPFRTETVDRSQPAVLKAIQDLEQLRAASGHFEVIVDVEKDTRFVPALIRGERVLFVAVGSVDAGVDLGGIDEDAVDVTGRSATIVLPEARLLGVRVDPDRSYVYDRDRGLIDRVASVFQDSPTGERQLYSLAEDKLVEAARGGSGLLPRAERNTRATLTALLRALGFEQIVVQFRAAT